MLPNVSMPLPSKGDSPQEIKQFHSLFDNVSSSIKAKRVFTQEDGASSHFQIDKMPLLEQVAYDWLDELLEVA